MRPATPMRRARWRPRPAPPRAPRPERPRPAFLTTSADATRTRALTAIGADTLDHLTAIAKTHGIGTALARSLMLVPPGSLRALARLERDAHRGFAPDAFLNVPAWRSKRLRTWRWLKAFAQDLHNPVFITLHLDALDLEDLKAAPFIFDHLAVNTIFKRVRGILAGPARIWLEVSDYGTLHVHAIAEAQPGPLPGEAKTLPQGAPMTVVKPVYALDGVAFYGTKPKLSSSANMIALYALARVLAGAIGRKLPRTARTWTKGLRPPAPSSLESAASIGEPAAPARSEPDEANPASRELATPSATSRRPRRVTVVVEPRPVRVAHPARPPPAARGPRPQRPRPPPATLTVKGPEASFDPPSRGDPCRAPRQYPC